MTFGGSEVSQLWRGIKPFLSFGFKVTLKRPFGIGTTSTEPSGGSQNCGSVRSRTRYCHANWTFRRVERFPFATPAVLRVRRSTRAIRYHPSHDESFVAFRIWKAGDGGSPDAAPRAGRCTYS